MAIQHALKQGSIRLALGILWLMHFLPLPVLAAIARGLGPLLFQLATSRRRVGLRNLALCFPHMPGAEREALLVGSEGRGQHALALDDDATEVPELVAGGMNGGDR